MTKGGRELERVLGELEAAQSLPEIRAAHAACEEYEMACGGAVIGPVEVITIGAPPVSVEELHLRVLSQEEQIRRLQGRVDYLYERAALRDERKGWE